MQPDLALVSPLDWALHYIQHGLYVFPLHTPRGTGCSCGKAPCKDAGKHPRTEHGFHDATIDPGLVREWFHCCSDANVGIATGQKSGIIVLDVDFRSGGDVSIAELIDRFGWFDTPVVKTGDGRHLYFNHPGGQVPCTRSLSGYPGIDLRGDGGYVVAPPSLHPSGRRYVWD
ncbi:MAG: bifunctional DNA primase/polymerase [Deltaproteobacteria bacterium]|nr:bifunctional DNA primase/polymerase [Deltaproteobacteria bacterium]